MQVANFLVQRMERWRAGRELFRPGDGLLWEIGWCLGLLLPGKIKFSRLMSKSRGAFFLKIIIDKKRESQALQSDLKRREREREGREVWAGKKTSVWRFRAVPRPDQKFQQGQESGRLGLYIG